MKSDRKWLLLVLLAWLLLFLSLLCHFLDLRSSLLPQSRSAAESQPTRSETRRLASVQGGLRTQRSAGESVADWRRRRRRRTEYRSRSQDVHISRSEDDYRARSEEYYRSRSLELLQRLWSGNLTAGMLSPRLQKVLKVQLSSNRHQVVQRGSRGVRRSGPQLYCELKRRTRVRTVDGTEEPFASLGWDRLVPSLSLQELRTSQYQRCAVVTSAGAVLNSSLGTEIDSHDAVLRFNAAPTRGFERDVGNKTTIRIINSQIVARPKYNFSSSLLYEDVILLVWDPAQYDANLTQWFQRPDFDLFSAYIERRRLRPEQPFYILHPQFIWSLWDLIQDNTEDPIQPNPPSSGFTGILLMMSLCREVSVYEFIPSLRRTDLCHYYERYHDAACTLGAYHPLMYEKLLVQRINMADQDQLRRRGRVTLRGFSTVHCGS
ncbi:beta-galactoside alpha-2,6-sialyltransferase 2-like [Epinephelus lanceolatus]|uniref:beta-galactoside alpha-2,6-sialyltransferase 2-like n=1 Tax=Epinephelus lanceolatus TaxID=310571 RepID=UPI001447C1A9|nr:beta-galactoside alpha-2,6-sialyltransferase 2-like [Epinephelus lanceolatus]XP_033471797.1 beta-galactoside alpha-2,6-sialyltransferase 2-like [Epinephelus lanceolatus]